ncbi:MAG: peptidylprolyl isomerase [Chitinophaga sp.]|uniref:peptidylprolyl isomerase n=1 Tax=Chitinophaga sp. TaxID=1869181 RepID=UPI001B294576|nr:peptidylprolyl isomerase [Chitinophaga sp.]MBO9729122.1 peptidylprolyl isomerase [Chitinophaga sp.]
MKKLLPLSILLLFFVYAGTAKDRKVKMITPYGTMIIKLYDQTPKHRNNFIKLAKKHFYDSTLFHRVINNFMIQGGDPDSKHAHPGDTLGNGDVGYTIPPEFQLDLFHRKGALAAAREDRPDKASSGCQFYIVQGKVFTDDQLDKLEKTRLGGRKIPVDQRRIYKTEGGTPHLDQNYTVFGQVIKGMDVIDKIAALKTDSHDRPLEDVRIKVKVLKKWWLF